MADVVVDDPRSDADLERYAEVQAESFAETHDEALSWLQRMRPWALMRCARAGDEIVGGYICMPCGQFFGGRSVPALAVAGVVVSPAWRRRGVAGALMRDLVERAAAEHMALAPLHAATTRLYRRWGWEIGDQSLRIHVRSDALSALRGEGHAVRRPPIAAAQALRASVLPSWDGPLDRPDWWLDVEWPSGPDRPENHSYGWMEGDRLTGFMRYLERRDWPWMELIVMELTVATPDALRGLLGFIGGHEAQAPDVVFARSSLRARNELLFLLPDADKVVSVEAHICWMQRIVDLEAAVRARGWPAHVAGRVELEVGDPVRGTERVVLEVADGAGHVSPGGAGRVQLGIGALASWYSGTLRARDGVRIQLIDAPATDVAVMDAMLGDREPWMPDYF